MKRRRKNENNIKKPVKMRFHSFVGYAILLTIVWHGCNNTAEPQPQSIPKHQIVRMKIIYPDQPVTPMTDTDQMAQSSELSKDDDTIQFAYNSQNTTQSPLETQRENSSPLETQRENSSPLETQRANQTTNAVSESSPQTTQTINKLSATDTPPASRIPDPEAFSESFAQSFGESYSHSLSETPNQHLEEQQTAQDIETNEDKLGAVNNVPNKPNTNELSNNPPVVSNTTNSSATLNQNNLDNNNTSDLQENSEISDSNQTQSNTPQFIVGQFYPVYKPPLKLDPFKPLITKKKKETAPPPDKKIEKKIKKKKRILTQLEKFDLSQLKLTGVILTQKGGKAIVEESTGRGYIVKPGTLIGRNSGTVIQIYLDRIVVEEPVEGFAGKISYVRKEMKLHKPDGEF